jgi:uncharacterized caspase-like protein
MEASMLKHLVASLISLTTLLLTLHGAAAEKRVALVIGNSAYQHTAPLRNPSNDATDFAGKLRDLGFDVIDGTDLNKRDMEQRIRAFADKLIGSDVGLFFYAGHGLQVDGKNFLAPVDASLKSDTDLDFEAVELNLVLKQMERNSRVSIVFLDACRDNPLASIAQTGRSVDVGRGLARVDKAVGMMIAFSTQPGNVALDGQGRNSPFTEALLRHVAAEGASINDVMIDVRNDVLKATDGKQVPWENSSLTGQFFFKPGTPQAGAGASPDTSADIAALREQIARLQTDQGARLQSQQEQLEVLQKKLAAETSGAGRPQQQASAEIPPAGPPPAGETATNRVITVEPANAGAASATPPEASAALPTPATSPKAPEDAKVAVADSPEAKEPEAPKDTAAPLPEGVTREQLAVDIVTGLKELDCYRGRVTGNWGDRSQEALGRFNTVSSLDLPLDTPEPATLDAIKGWKGAHCDIEQAVVPHLAPKLHRPSAPQEVVIPKSYKRAPYRPDAASGPAQPHRHADDELNELQRLFPQTYNRSR